MLEIKKRKTNFWKVSLWYLRIASSILINVRCWCACVQVQFRYSVGTHQTSFFLSPMVTARVIKERVSSCLYCYGEPYIKWLCNKFIEQRLYLTNTLSTPIITYQQFFIIKITMKVKIWSKEYLLQGFYTSCACSWILSPLYVSWTLGNSKGIMTDLSLLHEDIWKLGWFLIYRLAILLANTF